MIKNYTTKVSALRTIFEIETILSKNGATDILKKYKDGNVESIMFRIEIKGQFYPYKLPLQEDKISHIIKKAVECKELPKSYLSNTDRARRIGWRIIKDCIESQMALVQIEMVQIDEVLLPYMYNEKEDKTLYEMMIDKGFDKLLGYKE